MGAGRPLPADGAIQVAFDRYLLPSTVTRQAITVVTAEGEPLPAAGLPVVTYDPVARTATLIPPRGPWLEPGTLYRLVLSIPAGDEDSAGVRAIDRATLDPSQDRVFEFLVTEPTGAAYDEGRVHFCADVLPILLAKCSGGRCHGGETPASGLVLTTPEGLEATAIGRVARGASTSGRAGIPEAPGRAFGVNMAVIEPGSPGASWLVYKTELAALGPSIAAPPACASPDAAGPSPPYVPLTQPLLEPGAGERAALGAFMTGAPMPYPVLGPEGPRPDGLAFEERETLRRWIAQLVPGDPLPRCACR